MKNKLKALIVAAVLAVSPAVSFAATTPIDTTDVVAQIAVVGTATIVAIGGAKIVLGAVAMTFKWAKGAIFG